MINEDMEEIKEVINCDADAEIKCKMISNILTAKPHYFKEQKPCEDCISREAVIEWLKAKDIIKLSLQEETVKRELKTLSSIKLQEPKIDVLDKIRAEIIDTGAYEQEVNGKTEFLKGISYCLGVIDKYKTEKE